MITYLTTLPSPVGTLTLAADGTALKASLKALGYDDRGEAIRENNKVYRIREINLHPDFDPTVNFMNRTVEYDTVASYPSST